MLCDLPNPAPPSNPAPNTAPETELVLRQWNSMRGSFILQDTFVSFLTYLFIVTQRLQRSAKLSYTIQSTRQPSIAQDKPRNILTAEIENTWMAGVGFQSTSLKLINLNIKRRSGSILQVSLHSYTSQKNSVYSEFLFLYILEKSLSFGWLFQ